MQKKLLAAAIAASLGMAGNVAAATLEDRLAAMEKRMSYLEQRVQDQDRVIAEKNDQIAELTGGSGGGGWFNRIEVGGVVEVEASHTSIDGAPDESDIITATVELGIATQINDWVGAEIVLLYEEETDNDGDFNVDTAVISVADPNNSWFINAGQMYVPFGMYATNMISDPITLELGETNDSAIEFGLGFEGVTASAYVFQGDRGTEIDKVGAALNFETDGDGFAVAGHLGYISDLVESDGFGPGSIGTRDELPAWTIGAEVSVGDFVIIGEYLAATDEINNTGDEPSAFNIEAGYNFGVADRPATFAIGYQGTDEAGVPGYNLDNRIITAFTMEIMDGTVIGIEYAMDEAYDGTESDTVTGLLAVEF